MSVKTKLTEIANDIREILNENGGMTLDDMAAKLDTVKTQIVNAIKAANAAFGDVSTLPEMSEKVQEFTEEIMTWMMLAASTAVLLNGMVLDDYVGENEVVDAEGLKETLTQEAVTMRNMLDNCYSIIAGYGDVQVPGEGERYLKNLPQALESLGSMVEQTTLAAQSWYEVTLYTMHIVNGTDISNAKPEDVLKEETLQALTQELTVIQQAMEKTVEAITEMGGTAPAAAEVSMFPDAIRTIGTGTDVRVSSGTARTGIEGTATVECGFKPDLVVLTGYTVSYGSSYNLEYQLSFCFDAALHEGENNYYLSARAGSSEYSNDISAYFTRSDTGFSVDLTTNNGSQVQHLGNKQFTYKAVKYTE